jgi:ABC-type methionine transport system ATPase subunit
MAVKKKAARKKTAPKKKAAQRKSVTAGKQIARYWWTYPAERITEPVIWQVGRKFEVVTNVRQASVAKDIAIVSVQLEGTRDEIKKAVAWVEKRGIAVEPVEIGAIAG